MPTFEFTSPEGKRYAVTGPEGATSAQAFAILQGQISTGTAQAANPQTDGVPNAYGQNAPAPSAPAPARSLGDKVEGGIETALALGTGATGGTLGMIGGTVKGLAGAVMDGTFGTQAGVQQVEQSAADGMAALTYAPRGEAGQEMTETVGKAMQAVLPATPLTSELQAIGTAASAGANVGRNLGTAAVQNSVARIKTAAPAIAERLERTLRRNPEPSGQRAGGSVGAQGVEVAEMRRQAAQSLPVPMDITEGMATRDRMQLQFENETAKLEAGGALRERGAELNEKALQNFDAFVDMTGAEAPSLRAVGQAVDGVLKAKAARDKAQIRVAYKDAEKAGEMEGPVTLGGLVEHLNESAPDAATAPLLNVARQRAIQLGIAAEGDGGALVALPTTIKNAERMRQAIGRATDYEATNIRQSAIIKSEIDAATEGAGGQAYKTARRLRENFAKQYEDRAVIASLLNNKKGMADRKVALEDVFAESILKGSMDDTRHVRRVLHAAGEDGKQAWRELQGATMNWLKEESTKNVATDTRGNTIVSPAQLNKAIRQLDADGKLDFVFGKQGAAQVRDLNDIVKVIHTVPPGSVNYSNTASVILNALGAGSAEAAIVGLLTGLPVPVLTGAKLLAAKAKNVKLQKRIAAALERRPRPEQPSQF